MPDTPGWRDRAIDAIRASLGEDRVSTGETVQSELASRRLNPDEGATLRTILHPQSTEECGFMLAALASSDCRPDVIGELTTFWEPHPSDGDVAIDVRSLRSPSRIDAAERIGYFGAGVTVREIDRQARAEGLCLRAYPDSDGSPSIGSIAAVACTAGLGLGRIQPVEQILGLTVVTPAGVAMRTGAAWRRGRGGVVHGVPDPTGIFFGSQGRLGVITEVVVALAAAPFLAARTWRAPWDLPDEIASQLRSARRALDTGGIDSLRLEAVCQGPDQPTATDWFLRCWSPRSAESAELYCAQVARSLGAQSPDGWVESAAGRRGELPDHDQRYSVPPGTHRVHTGDRGFLGIEVTVNWGAQLDEAVTLFADLFTDLADLAPGFRRLGIYPGPHAVSIGVQVMLTDGRASAADVRSRLSNVVAPLNACGAVPYRPGAVWSAASGDTGDDAAAALIRGLTPGAQ